MEKTYTKGYAINIEQETLENNFYRRVLYTTQKSQLVIMAIQPGDEIGEEVHELDQFIRLEQGEAEVYIDGEVQVVMDDWAVVIPAGSRHNVINVGDTVLKLYSVYSPPEHKDGIVHETKLDDKEEHFDGTVTHG